MEFYFQTFGSISILVVEIKHKFVNILDAMAQVMAECDGQLYFFPLSSSGCLFIYDL